MGVVNVTPDSFSDGGVVRPDAAIAPRPRPGRRGRRHRRRGRRVHPARARRGCRWRRNCAGSIPVIRALAAEGVAVSVDTMRAEVAEAAVAAGAALVNDVSGGLADPDDAAGGGRGRRAVRGDALARAQPRHGAAAPSTATSWPRWREELRKRVDAVLAEGVARGADRRSTPASDSPRTPSTTGRCWPRSRRADRLGRPVLVGASRKSFLGRLLPGPTARPGRSTAATTPHWPSPRWPRGRRMVRAGARVRANADAVRVAAAWREQPDAADDER